MPTLIACLSSGKGTWTEVSKIIASQPWSTVFLIVDNFGKEKYIPAPATELLVVDFSKELPLLVQQIVQSLRGKVLDFEIALNLASGTGKEHMAILEAVMELGLNFRLVTVVNNQVEVLGLKR